ncbi:MAG TPA: hypothetical protein VNS49_05960 [Streptomyces sp.]|nr:hypothetical protein [Streptomyces sp.]
MRHRRHTLRATALLPCVAVLLVAPLTSAASGPGGHSDEQTASSSGRSQPAAMAPGLSPQEPDVAVESGPFSVRVRVSGTEVVVSTPDPGRSSPRDKSSAREPGPPEKSPGSAGTSHSSTQGGREDARRQTPGRNADEDRTASSRHPHRSPGSAHPHRSPASVRPEHSRTPSGRHQHVPSSGDSSDRAHGAGRADGADRSDRPDGPERADESWDDGDMDNKGDEGAVFGTHDLYAPDPPERNAGDGPERETRPAAGGGVSPVLPLGAGLTSIGLGLALLALRLRRG